MLEMQKIVLEKVSFDQSLFRKELLKSLKWLKKEEALLLKAWCLATFAGSYDEIVREVFERMNG